MRKNPNCLVVRIFLFIFAASLVCYFVVSEHLIYEKYVCLTNIEEDGRQEISYPRR